MLPCDETTLNPLRIGGPPFREGRVSESILILRLVLPIEMIYHSGRSSGDREAHGSSVDPCVVRKTATRARGAASRLVGYAGEVRGLSKSRVEFEGSVGQ
jgi:hypothetical protein